MNHEKTAAKTNREIILGLLQDLREEIQEEDNEARVYRWRNQLDMREMQETIEDGNSSPDRRCIYIRRGT